MAIRCPQCESVDALVFRPWVTVRAGRRWWRPWRVALLRRETALVVRCARCLHEYLATVDGARPVPVVAEPKAEERRMAKPVRGDADPTGALWNAEAKRA